MKPTVGRIVHFKIGNDVRAALITHVWTEECVNLAIFNDASLDAGYPAVQQRTSVIKGADIGKWDWPERSEG